MCHTAEHNLALHPYANGHAEESKHGHYEEALKTADDAQFYGAAVGLEGSRGKGLQISCWKPNAPFGSLKPTANKKSPRHLNIGMLGPIIIVSSSHHDKP